MFCFSLVAKEHVINFLCLLCYVVILQFFSTVVERVLSVQCEFRQSEV
jgi:hypothetical protein